MTHLLFWSLRIKGQADDRRVIRTYGHSNFRIFAACHDLLPRPRTRATHARTVGRYGAAYAWYARGFTSASTVPSTRSSSNGVLMTSCYNHAHAHAARAFQIDYNCICAPPPPLEREKGRVTSRRLVVINPAAL